MKRNLNELDDFVSQDNPARVIDLFVDKLDISGLGFRTETVSAGRPGYHPRTMLKLYIAPDFKTIADFRKDSGKAIQLVCKQFVELCRKLELLTDDFVAV